MKTNYKNNSNHIYFKNNSFYYLLLSLFVFSSFYISSVSATASSNNNNDNHHEKKPSSSSSKSSTAISKVCKGTIEDAVCEFDTIDSINDQLRPDLTAILRTKYFRYYKIDLFKGCPFWNEQFYCVQKDCSVETLGNENELPDEWKAKSLSAVDFSQNGFGFNSFKKRCKFTEKDFCYLDDENSSEGKYVNLLKNPERFTGYNGESAAKIWGSIYKENCFNFLGHEIYHGFFARDFPSDLCVEKRVFYKMFSGLHASISTHICEEHLNRTTGEWYSDLDCYMSRVGKHPDRIGNLYFLFSVVLQSIRKAINYFENYNLCSGEDEETLYTQKLFQNILNIVKQQPPTFNERYLFSNNEAYTLSLKEEFKERFRNISRIMDCVSCEKCRLWGKLQTSGLGTALKILFSFDGETTDYKLTRNEIIALFNSFGRLSNSIKAKENFVQMLYLRSLSENTESKVDTNLYLEYIYNLKDLLDGKLLTLVQTNPEWAVYSTRGLLGILIAIILLFSRKSNSMTASSKKKKSGSESPKKSTNSKTKRKTN